MAYDPADARVTAVFSRRRLPSGDFVQDPLKFRFVRYDNKPEKELEPASDIVWSNDFASFDVAAAPSPIEAVEYVDSRTINGLHRFD